MEQPQQQEEDLLFGGVQPKVYAAVMNLCNDAKDPTNRRWLYIRHMGTNTVITQHDALFIVAELEAILIDEQQELEATSAARVAAAAPAGAFSSSSSTTTTSANSSQRTGLVLDANLLSEEAVEVFSDYFQPTTGKGDENIHLRALILVCPNAALLRSLHDNRSIKDLSIRAVFEDLGDTIGQCIGQLLEHKTDSFESLWFEGIGGSITLSHVLPFLGRKHPHLKKLGFADCVLDENDIEVFIRAMLEGGCDSYRNLQMLSFASNHELEARALHWFSALDRANFPCLERLDLSSNPGLLIDKDVTTHFVQQVVSPAQGTTVLNELNLSHCSDKNQGHPTIIIQALANDRNTPLVSLDLTCWTDDDLCNRHAIRNELVESLPKMKKTEGLKFNEQLFDVNDQELIAAFSKNTSILKLFSMNDDDHGPFAAILKRNNDMVHVRQLLLGTTTSNTKTTTNAATSIPPRPIPRSLWPRVLAKVGHGSHGASPSFMILQARLAGWPESNIIKSSNKRKRIES